MTSQFRSHIEYLIQTSCTHFLVEIDEKLVIMAGLNRDLMMTSDSGLLFPPPCIAYTDCLTSADCRHVIL